MAYVLFISEPKLKESTAINLNVDVNLLLPYVRQAQKLYDAISTEQAQHLREEVSNTAQYYTERMIEYVTNNLSSFPEYSTNTGADVDPDVNAYYNGMNLERPMKQGTAIRLRNFLNPGD
jgi:hypothetical protein